MSEVGDVLKQLITMGARFESLQQQVIRIEDRQTQLLDRLSRLEERLNTVNESSRSAAQVGVAELKAQLIERITRLEVEQSSPRSTEKQIEAAKRDEDQRGDAR